MGKLIEINDNKAVMMMHRKAPEYVIEFWSGIAVTSYTDRDGRFGSKVGQIGPQIGQIRDFFRSDFSTFGSSSQMY